MNESTWTADELDRIGGAEELANAPRRADGTLRRPLPIWVVRVGDDLYVRSWRGDDGSWYRAARATGEGHISAGVDRDVAYRDKYGRYPSYVEPMVAAAARATTLRLVPRDGAHRS